MSVWRTVHPFIEVSAFWAKAIFSARRKELEESEILVENLRKQLEAAMAEARAKREAAVAAKRKFESARRALEAEMAAVREKVQAYIYITHPFPFSWQA